MEVQTVNLSDRLSKLYTLACNIRFNSSNLSHEALTYMTLQLITLMRSINAECVDPAILHHIERTSMTSPMREKLKYFMSQLSEVYKPGRDESKIAASVTRSFTAKTAYA